MEEKQLREKGNLSKKSLSRSYKKINPIKLIECIEQHSDACQGEIEKEFNCSQTAIWKALKRLGIIHKKRQSTIKNKIQ